MSEGPGDYDEFATSIREQVQAEGVIVIVLGGNRGSAFAQTWAVQSADTMPDRLMAGARAVRSVAEQMERDARVMRARRARQKDS